MSEPIEKGFEAKQRPFRPYPEYKDSGVEWLGEIPEHWEVKRLWHLTPPYRRIMYGIVLPGPNVEDGVTIVKGGDVSPERLRLDRLSRTTREIESGYARSRLKGCDLVYAIRGSIGEVAMVPDELEGANLTQDAARVAYTAGVHGPWLLQELKCLAVFAQLEAGALGATIRGINIRDLKRASIPVPPQAEQRAIAAFLDRETARIDALVAKKERLIELLQEKRTALITRAVTKGLDPNVPMKDSGVEWLGEIPAHWGVKKLKHVSSVRGRIGFRGYTTADQVAEGQGALSLGATQFSTDGKVDLESPVFISWHKYHESPEIMVKKGEVLVVQRGSTSGKVGFIDREIGPATINPSMIVLKDITISGELLFRILSSRHVAAAFDSFVSATAIPMLSQQQVENLQVCVPPASEANGILEMTHSNTEKIDSLIARIREAIDRLKELRTALISAAVTGKIDVRGA